MSNMYKLIFKLLILFLWILNLVKSNISVLGPLSLKEAVADLEKKEITINIANFGSVPYGKSLIGEVFEAIPKKACEKINISTIQQEDKKIGAPIIITERGGGCSFVEKAHFAQMAGAKLLIIVDNNIESTQSVIMVEDGYGDIINIPVVMISKKEGSLIFKELDNKENNKNHVEIKIYFEAPEKEKNVRLMFWLNIENRDSYRLVRDFKDVALQLGNRVKFQPHYQVYQEDFSQLLQLQDETKNCLGDNLYCMSDPDGYEGKATGRDVLKEIIRQLCIYEHNQNKWWDYMDQFDQQCVKATTSKDCGEKLEKKLGIDVQKTNKCIIKSILTDEDTPDINESNILDYLIRFDNQKLKDERQASQNIYYWPAVTLGNQSYRGNLDKYDLLEAICSGMKDPHSKCKEVQGGVGYVQDGKGNSDVGIIFIVIIMLIVFFFFMIYVYKRMAKRELSREMSSQVNQMVSQYIAFYETRDKKSSNV